MAKLPYPPEFRATMCTVMIIKQLLDTMSRSGTIKPQEQKKEQTKGKDILL